MQTSDEHAPSQFVIWSSILSEKDAAVAPSYVPPIVRRSSSSMSRESLEICTESLGSETGSDDYSSSSADGEFDRLVEDDEDVEEEEEDEDVGEEGGVVGRGVMRRREGKDLVAVNYHCAVGRRSPQPTRSFPPPLTSIARRDSPCIHLRPHRRDGRLVVEAVSVPPVNYLHARRVHGRLVLSFIDAVVAGDSAPEVAREMNSKESEENNGYEEEEEEEEEVEEEEVEVVDRGTVIEVKVSTQPQQQSGATALKVHRSSVVINKFVGGSPLSGAIQCQQAAEIRNEALRRVSLTATAAAPTAATVVAASTLGAAEEGYSGGFWTPPDNKQLLLITSKRRNREELLRDMRRCSQLRRPLFIWEPCCIATSSS